EAERAVAALERDDARHMRHAEVGGDLGRHLPRLGVDGLAPADDDVGSELAEGERERPRRADRVRDGEDAVGEVDVAVVWSGKLPRLHGRIAWRRGNLPDHTTATS